MPIDESRLRHRRERPIFFVSVVINLALMGLALYLVTYGSDWLKRFPRLAERAENVRGLALAAVLAIPTLPLMRNLRRAHVRGHSIQVSSHQLPNIHAKLVQQCGMIGMPVPELYVSDEAIKEDARGYSAWKCDYIVLSTKYLDRDLQGSREVIAFLLGRELGRIRLGQAAWWDEMLLAYIVLVPVLRRPLRRIRAYSRDRYGAVLAPEGLKGNPGGSCWPSRVARRGPSGVCEGAGPTRGVLGQVLRAHVRGTAHQQPDSRAARGGAATIARSARGGDARHGLAAG